MNDVRRLAVFVMVSCCITASIWAVGSYVGMHDRFNGIGTTWATRTCPTCKSRTVWKYIDGVKTHFCTTCDKVVGD